MYVCSSSAQRRFESIWLITRLQDQDWISELPPSLTGSSLLSCIATSGWNRCDTWHLVRKSPASSCRTSPAWYKSPEDTVQILVSGLVFWGKKWWFFLKKNQFNHKTASFLCEKMCHIFEIFKIIWPYSSSAKYSTSHRNRNFFPRWHTVSLSWVSITGPLWRTCSLPWLTRLPRSVPRAGSLPAGAGRWGRRSRGRPLETRAGRSSRWSPEWW